MFLDGYMPLLFLLQIFYPSNGAKVSLGTFPTEEEAIRRLLAGSEARKKTKVL